MALTTFSERRRLLQAALASAATGCLPRAAWSQPRFTSNPFTLGVASGSPTHDSVVLWTRLLQTGFLGGSSLGPEAIAVRWEMADDAQFKRPVQRGQTLALSELAHSVHVEVAGLEPDRWYFYRFMAGDAVSPTGRTRTFPAPGAEVARLRLAYASCQRWEHGYFSAYRHMLAENLDAVMFLGDYIYEYPGAVNAVRMPTGGWVRTLDDYRARYALYKGEADLQAMHAQCPWLVTWDDHEVQNDYAGLISSKSGAEETDFPARRAAAYQAYYEHMPLRASVLMQGLTGLSRGAEMRIYGSLRYGKLAMLYLLDERQYRDPQACTPGDKSGGTLVNPAHCASWNDPQRSLLGAAQEQWLDAAFGQGSSGWNVLAQQTAFGRRNFKTSPGEALSSDAWDGYAPARKRLTDSMQRHQIANPVVLGGDVHANWVGHVLADYARPDSAVLGVEFCGTSITSRAGGNIKLAARLAENPHYVFAEAEHHGYGVAEFTPKQLTTTLRVVDDVTRPDTRIETLAQFVVQAGRARVQRLR